MQGEALLIPQKKRDGVQKEGRESKRDEDQKEGWESKVGMGTKKRDGNQKEGW